MEAHRVAHLGVGRADHQAVQGEQATPTSASGRSPGWPGAGAAGPGWPGGRGRRRDVAATRGDGPPAVPAGGVAVTSPPGACRRPGPRRPSRERRRRRAARTRASRRRGRRPSAASNARVAPMSTGASTGSSSRGSSVSRTRRPADERAVERTGGATATVAARHGGEQQADPGGVGAVEDDDADAEQHLEREQLGADGQRLAEEDAGGVEPGEAQRVADAVGLVELGAAARASRAENSTATQNRPGVARSSTPRSGSRAKANSTSTSRANGATWCMVTRLRASMRRSCRRPAWRHATWVTSGAAGRGRRRPTSVPGAGAGASEAGRRGRGRDVGVARRDGPVGRATDEHDDPVGQRLGPVELVRRQHHRGALGDRLADEPVEQVAGVASSPAWGSSSSHSSGRRASRQASDGAPALAGRQPGHRHVAQPAVEPDQGQGGVDVGGRRPRRPGPRTARCRPPSGRRTGRWRGRAGRRAGGPAGVAAQVVTEHRRPRRDHRHQARAGAQHRGLACTVRARGGGRSRPRRRRGRPRRAQGIVRAAPRRRGGGRPAPWRRREGTDGPRGPPRQRPPAWRRAADDPAGRRCEGLYALRPSCVWPGSSARSAACITAGVLILLFVAYQLWGTGIREAQAQDAARERVRRAHRRRSTPRTRPRPTDDHARGATAHDRARPPATAAGRRRRRWPAAHPRHRRRQDRGRGREVVRPQAGPGHYPDTPLPGQPGNAAIAGHRTTYGAPFNRIDELEQGDEILVTTAQGAFRYEVSASSSSAPTRSRCSTTSATTASR